MEKVIINVAKTELGYSADCDLLPGSVIAYTGNFDGFKKFVQESIDFEIGCAKEDNEDYPEIFKTEYSVSYKFDIESLLCFYQSIFSFSALQTITGINQKQLAHYAAGRSKPRRAQAEKIISGLHRLASDLNTVTV